MAYVGQTSLHPYLRWKQGSGYSNKHFKDLKKDLKEIGWSNFKHIILEDNVLAQEKADELEKYYIDKHSNENGVYNSNSRGIGKGYKRKKKIPVYQIDNNLNIIAEFDSAVEATSKMLYDLEDEGKDISKIILLSSIRNHIIGKASYAFGYYWCKKSDYKPDWKPKEYKIIPVKIVQYDLQGNFIQEWPSISSASKELNIVEAGISSTCRGIQKKAGGFIWKYLGDNDLSINLRKDNLKKPIIQYDLKGNFIKEWESASDAGEKLNIFSSTISATCLNKKKKAGGFIWKFVGDNDFSFNFLPNMPKSKKVIQYDLNGHFIKEWDSIKQASKELNITTGLSSVCRGKLKTAGGFIWKYPGDNDFSSNFKKHSNGKKVIQYDLKGNFIKEWDSVSDAARTLNVSISNIRDVCTGKTKTALGFIWKYYGDNDFSRNFEPNKALEKKLFQRKKVFQYDLNGNFVKEWGSMVEASKALNVPKSQASRACRGKLKTAGGFIWKYANSSDKSPEKVV